MSRSLNLRLSELQAQFAIGEDSRLQFKRDVTNADTLAAETAAFANSNIRNPILVSYIAKGLRPTGDSALASSGRWKTGPRSTSLTTGTAACSPPRFTGGKLKVR